MGHQLVVLALIILAVGGLTSANGTASAPSSIKDSSGVEATNEALSPLAIEETDAALDGPPTASEDPISELPSESPKVPSAGGLVAPSPSLLDKKRFPIDPVSPPAPEIQSLPPVATAGPTTPAADVPQSGAATLKMSFVVVLAAVVGAFSL